MGDVAGAFKILIEAQPDKAIDAFRDVLNATNQAHAGTTSWAEGITGLNSAFELGEKAIDIAAEGIHKLNEYASEGGKIAALRDNFTSFAKNVGVDAEKVVKSIVNLSGGTITEFDAMKMASRDVFKGFSGEEITKIMGFAKSAASHGIGDLESNFDGLSQAILSGSSKALKGFGLMIEKGAPVADVFAAMDEKMSNVVATAPSISKVGDAIAVSFKDMKEGAEEAVARSGPLKDIYLEINQVLKEFVAGLDFKVITDWVSVGVSGAKEMLSGFGISFSGILDFVKNTFNNSGDIAKSFFKVTVDAAFIAFNTLENIIAPVYNSLLGFAQWFNSGNWIGRGLDGAVQAVTWAVSTVASMVETLFSTVLDGWSEIFTGIADITRDHPKIAEKLGLSPEMFDGISKSLQSGKDGIKDFVSGINSTLEGASGVSEKFFGGLNQDFEAMKYNVGASGEYYAEALTKINSLKIGGKADLAKDLKDVNEQSIASKKALMLEEGEMDKAAKARDKELRKSHLDWIKDQFKEEKTAAQDAFDFMISNEEKAFRRNQDDAMETFKKTIADRKYVTDENGTTTYFNDIKNLTDAEQKMFKDNMDAELKRMKRSQEDSMDQYKEEEKQKKRGFSSEWDDILKKRTGEGGADPLPDAAEAASNKTREELGKSAGKKLLIEFVKSGNEALDSLVQIIFDAAEARASDEGVKSYAP